jgi:signal transduction histidine kinase
MKFTDRGSVRLYVSLVELHPDDDFVSPPLKTIPHLLFRITDTGIGMDRETQNNLFQRFYQGKVSFTRQVWHCHSEVSCLTRSRLVVRDLDWPSLQSWSQ